LSIEGGAASDELPRRGFVLAAALLSMLLIAALLAAVFFATTEETRTAVASTASDAALSDAESAVQARVEALASGSGRFPEIGQTEAASDASGRWSVYVTRLDSTLIWIVGEATGTGAMTGTVRRIGVFAAMSTDSIGSIRLSPIPERGWSELF
jgi:Tfp pilus assembly protein PilX